MKKSIILSILIFSVSAASELMKEQEKYIKEIIDDSKYCQANAPAQSKVVPVTVENYEAEVINSSKPVLILVSAAWCPPCQIFKPIYDKVADECSDLFKFVSIDFDSYLEFIKEYEVNSVPTVLLVVQGKIVDKGSAFSNKNNFIAKIHKIREFIKEKHGF
jgi:thioredoxin 1